MGSLGTRMGRGMGAFGGLLLLIGVAGCDAPGRVAVPDRGQVRRILEDDRFDWVTVETAHTRIHFPSGSYAYARRLRLPARAEDARQAVLSRLGVPDDGLPFDLFYVDSRRDMETLTGSPVTGRSYPDDRAIVIVLNDGWRAFERHELTHAVTLASWARPAGPAVVEGLATFVDGRCGGYENGRVARTILDRGRFVPLEELVGEFRAQNDLIAYVQAATTIEFVVHERGLESVASLWNRGLQVSPSLVGTSTAAFPEALENWLTATYGPVPSCAWELIEEGGCGINAVAAGRCR